MRRRTASLNGTNYRIDVVHARAKPALAPTLPPYVVGEVGNNDQKVYGVGYLRFRTDEP